MEINKNYRLMRVQEDYFLVDIKEKNYGKNKSIIALNESAAKIWNLLQTMEVEDVIETLWKEEDNVFSVDELQESVNSLVEILAGKGAIIGEKQVCQELPKIPFGPFKGQNSARRQPLIGVVEITSLCNFNCPHCYVKGFRGANDISTDKIIEIAKIFKSKGILNVTLTGGEPISHPDFKKIYMAFKEEGFLIDIFSNGSLIDEEMADFLAEYPPRSIDITLYGLSDEEYKAFVGIDGAFTKVKNALDLLQEKGVFFTTKMVVNQANLCDVDKYNRFALEYNAPFRYNVVIGNGNNTLESPAEIMLTAEQIIELEKDDPLRVKILQSLASKATNLPAECASCDSWSQYLCSAGCDKVFVGSDGKMSPCMTLRNKGLSIFEYGYDYIWDYWGEKRKEKLSKDFECMNCKYLPICTPCTEEFEQVNGNREMPIKTRCELAKLRWENYIEGSSDKNEK